MKNNRKPTGRAMSMPAGLVMGGVTSLGVTLLCAGILAKILEAEVIPESSTGYGLIVLLIAASFAGAMVSSGKIKRQQLVVCAAAGAIYYGILLSITALFFGGQYSAVGETAMLVLCGSGLAFLLRARDGKRNRSPKIKIPHR